MGRVGRSETFDSGRLYDALLSAEPGDVVEGAPLLRGVGDEPTVWELLERDGDVLTCHVYWHGVLVDSVRVTAGKFGAEFRFGSDLDE